MAIRRLRPMLAAQLPNLPATCASCPLGNQIHFIKDPSWARAAEDRWGMCGIAAHHEGAVIGYALVTPALTLPKGHPITRWPRTPDSAVLLSTRVLDGWESGGVARQLIQAVSGRLVGEVRCLEAVGTTGPALCTTPSVAWLRSVGFVADERPRPLGWTDDLQRMRLSFDTTSRWRPGFRSMWGAVSDWVQQPLSGPEPARTSRPAPARPVPAGRS